MLDNHKSRNLMFRRLPAALFLLQVISTACFAAGEYSPGELLKESMRSIQRENYEEATGFMYEYLEVAAGSNSDRALQAGYTADCGES